MDIDDDGDVPAKSGGGKKRSVVVKAPGKAKGGKNGAWRELQTGQRDRPHADV